MIKLTKGELKKIFLKPGIFVVTALLVVALTFSALLFKPSQRTDANILSLKGSTVGQIYDKYYNSTNANVESSENIIDFYNSQLSGAKTKKQELLDGVDNIKSAFQKYKEYIYDTNSSTEETKDAKREAFKQAIEEFQSLYNTYIGGTNGFYYILLDSNSKNDLDVFLAKCLSSPFSNSIPHSEVPDIVEENLDMFNTLENYVNKMQVFLPTKEDLDQAKENLIDAKNKLLNLESEIETFNTEHGKENTIEVKQEFKTLMTRYVQASKNINSLTQRTIEASSLKDFSDDYIQSLYQFENAQYKTKYTIKEQKNICKFYLDNNKYAFEYANPLNLSTTSNSETNVYDFMFFALELCSFIIIIYVVFLGATMIAGEYSNGTMKLLAIRPYSRRKILFGKLLATLLVGLIFLLMTFVVTFIVGSILYSSVSLPMLLIFNAETVVSVNPIISILILFACKLVEMTFYAIFALSISTWFKSNSGSVVISLLLYFISFILSMFTSSLGIIKYLPFVNTNLFGYFGSHLASNSSKTIFSSLFSRVIANDMSFFGSFAIIAIFSIILYIITSEIFAKRDIK